MGSSKYHAAKRKPSAAGNSKLVEIGSRFEHLKRQAQGGPGIGDPNAALSSELTNDRYQEEMFELAWQAAADQTRDITALQIKARILLEYCVPADEDLIHDLARSLCQDILALRPSSRSSTN